MLENWCWTPSQLKFLSQHYSSISDAYLESWKESIGSKDATPPPAELPDELINSLIKTKHVNGALFNLRQLQVGIYDMTVHQPKSHEDIEKLDTSLTWGELRNAIMPYEGLEVSDGAKPDWAHGEAAFGHLMGGYDAGYYGYLASQVYSADMFHSVFEKNPLDGKEGRKYRQEILGWGGSRDEMTSLRTFLGREPSSEAFYRELGLEQK
jgi:metallopeptidase MepB